MTQFFKNMSGQGVHEKVFELAIPYLNAAKILVLGAGQGAFEHKLIINGISPYKITAADINPNNYVVDKIGCYFCDLNKSIPFDNSSFDLCFAIEVIEHLINPHNLIDEAHRILTRNGHLILTTPNMHSFMQKIRYLFTDRFGWFYDRDINGSGHIHPIFDWQIKHMVKNKFKLVRYDSQSFHLRLFPKAPAIPIPFRHRFFAVNNIYFFKKLS